VEELLRKWLPGPGFFTGSREVKRQDIWDEAFQQAATIEEKAAYEVWFKCVGRNKYALFDEVARERGTWDDLCVEPQVRAFARRGLCKPCKKYYDDSKGLETHEKRHHPRPPSQDSEREA